MKIPEKAKKVFEGIIFNVYQWEQEMFDGSIAIFEAIKRPSTVQVLPVTSDNKILVCHETQPGKGWKKGFFSGRLEKDELPLDGAKRELVEESGFTTDNWQLLKEIDVGGAKMEWFGYVYMATNCKKTQKQKLDTGEKIEILEYEIDDFFSNYSEILTDCYDIEFLDKNLDTIKQLLSN